MADPSQQQPLTEPHTNGVMDGLTEEEKSKMRPADIDAVRYRKRLKKKKKKWEKTKNCTILLLCSVLCVPFLIYTEFFICF